MLFALRFFASSLLRLTLDTVFAAFCPLPTVFLTPRFATCAWLGSSRRHSRDPSRKERIDLMLRYDSDFPAVAFRQAAYIFLQRFRNFLISASVHNEFAGENSGAAGPAFLSRSLT